MSTEAIICGGCGVRSHLSLVQNEINKGSKLKVRDILILKILFILKIKFTSCFSFLMFPLIPTKVTGILKK